MVILHAARHRLPVPRLARWMLALGIAASLAVNVAQGWSHGLTSAVVAAWPAVSLVGSYELLAWLIRTAAPSGPDRAPAADHGGPLADQPGVSPRAEDSHGQGPEPEDRQGHRVTPVPGVAGGSLPVARETADQASGPGWTGPDQASQAGHAGGQDQTTDLAAEPDHDTAIDAPASTPSPASDINAAAVTAYLDSLRAGAPLSERKLATMFGRTSRRWARNRMAEARQRLTTA
jgi:hypothetical protein